jgi:alkylation response protein AidB-like acyl-CoA dehydrogenase
MLWRRDCFPLSAVPREHVNALRQSQRWIGERVVRGRIIAVANSEPGAGGSLSHTKTIATTGADGIVRLTGRKTFATLGPDADYFLCAARTAADANGPARIDGYFVHRNAPGLSLDDKWNPLGMRPTASVGLQLNETPVEGVLGYPGCLEGVNARHWSTLLFSAVFLGIGQAALREGAIHACGSAWGRAKLAEHSLAIDAACGYLESVCQAEVWPMPAELLSRVQQVKTFVTQTVVQAATQVAMLSGGRCYSAQHPVYRLLADALAGPLLRPPLGSGMDAMIDRLATGDA